ncbi:MAG: response regulator [Fluviicoccus sp.]|uniref:response regulator n=1 Tax=Fluviicoccus sp. TaxID=2003552 RepID=UPI002723E8A8|nr:response regulator [Fluviicoccus sp.]MDO8330946.1 response regulator [Fluviicoccus sp.]
MNNNNPKVIVADDDDAIRSLMRMALENKGLDVLEAADGKEALELFRLHDVDLVMLDIRMPVMNGYEACQGIREMDRDHSIPIVMVTGLEDDSAITEAFLAGADEFVTKPINWLLLAHQVDFWINSSHALKSERRQHSTSNQVAMGLPDSIFSLSLEDRIIDLKPGDLGQALQWEGLSLKLNRLESFFPQEISSSMLEAVELARRQNSRQRLQYDLKAQDGSVRSIDVVIISDSDSGGIFLCVRELPPYSA